MATPCAVAASVRSGTQSIHIYLSTEDAASGKAAGSMKYNQATFGLQEGPVDGAASITAKNPAVEIQALVRSRDIPLWVVPTRTLASGSLVPQDTRVELARVERESAVVRLTRHDLLHLDETPLEERVSCQELSATPPPMQPRDLDGKVIALAAKNGLDVRTAPATEPVLRVFAPAAAGKEILLEAIRRRTDGNLTLVTVLSPHGDITGWVSTSAVRPRPAPATGILGNLPGAIARPRRDRDEGRRHRPPRGWSCSAPVPVAVIAPSHRGIVWIGRTRPGATLAAPTGEPIQDLPAGWIRVDLTGVWLRLIARQRDIESCSALDPRNSSSGVRD